MIAKPNQTRSQQSVFSHCGMMVHVLPKDELARDQGEGGILRRGIKVTPGISAAY